MMQDMLTRIVVYDASYAVGFLLMLLLRRGKRLVRFFAVSAQNRVPRADLRKRFDLRDPHIGLLYKANRVLPQGHGRPPCRRILRPCAVLLGIQAVLYAGNAELRGGLHPMAAVLHPYGGRRGDLACGAV
jgi:hypothetical protein